jgi:hypothetical protein
LKQNVVHLTPNFGVSALRRVPPVSPILKLIATRAFASRTGGALSLTAAWKRTGKNQSASICFEFASRGQRPHRSVTFGEIEIAVGDHPYVWSFKITTKHAKLMSRSHLPASPADRLADHQWSRGNPSNGLRISVLLTDFFPAFRVGIMLFLLNGGSAMGDRSHSLGIEILQQDDMRLFISPDDMISLLIT